MTSQTLIYIIFTLVIAYVSYYVINLLIKVRYISEPFISDDNGNPKFMLDMAYQSNYNKSLQRQDSHWLLQTDLVPSNPVISLVKPSRDSSLYSNNYFYINQSQSEIEKPNPKILIKQPSLKDKSQSNLLCVKNPSYITTKVKQIQPDIFNKPESIGIKTYYQRPYYYDKRFPLKPISTEFLTNSTDYCQRYPTEYPCYELFKHHSHKYFS